MYHATSSKKHQINISGVVEKQSENHLLIITKDQKRFCWHEYLHKKERNKKVCGVFASSKPNANQNLGLLVNNVRSL